MAHVCIHTGTHDASVTIVDKNKVLAHIIEERHTHITHTGYPIISLEKIKDYVDDIDALTFSDLFVRYFDPNPYRRFLQFKCNLSEKSRQNIHDKVYTINEHHKLHAICGCSFSGFRDAVVVVLDGAGHTFDYGKENLTIYDVSEKGLDTLYRSIVGNGENITDDAPNFVDKKTNIGAGYCYTAITEFIGFGTLQCGKTMGLSSYGEEDDRIPTLLKDDNTAGNHAFTLGKNPEYPWMGDTYTVLNDSLLWNDPIKWKDKIKNVLSVSSLDIDKDPKRFFTNVAYRIQSDYEKYLISTCERALSLSKSKNLILTGGCALNCVANYKLLKSLPNDVNLFIDPVSSDDGVSIGGACSMIDTHPSNIRSEIYLGGQLQYEYDLKGNDELDFDASSEDVAKLLTEGNIVAIAQGRSEIGPRALGNRSILFDPRVKNGKDIVNTVKKRESFRPFAGTVLLEHARDWFDMDRLEESPFMSYAIDVLPEKQELISSIVHFGKCRIQTVTREQNKHYYDLISEFYKQTDVPILFNTSFNLSGDTIAETIDDCFGTLRSSEIEYLYLPEINKLVYIPNK